MDALAHLATMTVGCANIRGSAYAVVGSMTLAAAANRRA
jgi:hypothetical protein